MFSDLTLDILKSGGMSLYSLFETRYGLRMIRADERLRAVSADRLSSELLQVAEGSPLLLVERVTFTVCEQARRMAAGVLFNAAFPLSQ